MKRVSQIISSLLVALVVLTAQSAAAARTMPDASGQMVICTGNGPMMIYIDANGEPTGAPQICPEYALSLIVAVALDAPVMSKRVVWSELRSVERVLKQATVRLGTPMARGPPVTD
ncbi:hypothetical protein LY10_00270 [Planktotalea frisia]|mgnify:CR=1 FL=1|jgi:hypothetical protein|uniref:Uncharacterized protein n=1 Tax=Planktotalea frisia TaxID=696762 RepID=A0A1L9NXP7_9RHOB|nr:hypothetical protein [Planktotalea frisia]OJI93973.1 hypothetical protein PFRI_18740 [Planktotalea frisia]PZX35296.1 hypothetical protein LY10_00270 [Planktotalea frisia]